MILGSYIVKIEETRRSDTRQTSLEVYIYAKCVRCDKKTVDWKTIEKCSGLVIECGDCKKKPARFSIQDLLHRHLKDVAQKNNNANPALVQQHLSRWDNLYKELLPGYERLYK
jgi:NAD-dependent SIR2 family protein deacetylase